MKSLKSYVDSLIAEGIPYVDVIAQREHNEIVRYSNGIEPVSGDELLYMFSATKPITATCAIKLIEDGKLGLDDPVGDYIPEFKDTYLLDENGNKVRTKGKVTVRHLFTMTGGLTYNCRKYPIQESAIERGDKSITVAIAGSFAKAPLIAEPGEKYEYSLCHDALGAVIEVASGMRFSEYMKKTVLEPLGMTNTRFAGPEETDVSSMYIAKPDGKIEKQEKVNRLIFFDGYESGGAGLVSTVNDYSLFADMLASGGVGKNGARILSEESVKLLYGVQLPALDIDTGYTCLHGNDYGYGLGVRTRTKATEWGLPVGEFGWDGAACSFLMADPKNKISVFIGMHLMGWPNVFKGRHLEIVRRIYEELNI